MEGCLLGTTVKIPDSSTIVRDKPLACEAIVRARLKPSTTIACFCVDPYYTSYYEVYGDPTETRFW